MRIVFYDVTDTSCSAFSPRFQSLGETTMAARVTLTAILQLEELKKDTAVMRSVLSSVKQQ